MTFRVNIDFQFADIEQTTDKSVFNTKDTFLSYIFGVFFSCCNMLSPEITEFHKKQIPNILKSNLNDVKIDNILYYCTVKFN